MAITALKIHPNCCGGLKPLYLGFSRRSAHLKEEKNSSFDNLQQVSKDNFPTLLATGSVAYKFSQALKEMQASGETIKLYNKYYK